MAGRATVVGGRRVVAEVVRAGRAREVLVARGSLTSQGLRSVLAAADGAGVPVREVARVELDRMVPHHQGAVAVLARGPAHELGERALSDHQFSDDALVVVLDGVEDPQNLGAAARSAEAAGAAMLVSRVRRAASVTPAAVRASAGALVHLPHARVANVGRSIDRLKRAGFFVVGLDGGEPTTIYDRTCPDGRVAVVVGGEGTGMSRLVRERCDVVVSLPMRGEVGSLNVGAALAAALYGFVLPSRTV
jgi:23S rRNA (guanosine2251-2'-O)-methyltransferase